MKNIVEHFRNVAVANPEKTAVKIYNGTEMLESISYGELEKRSDYLAWGLSSRGVRPNMKVLFMAKPSLDLVALNLAVMKLGAVPVFIPENMDWSGILTCVMQTSAKVFVGSAKNMFMKVFFGRAFCTVDINILLARFQFLGGTPVKKLQGKSEAYPIYEFASNEAAAVVFSSGSTDMPKGAIYSTALMEHELNALNTEFALEGSRQCFSSLMFTALQCICLGNTCILHAGEDDTLKDALDASLADIAFCAYKQWQILAEKCKAEHAMCNSLKTAVILGKEPVLQLHNAVKTYCLPAGGESFSIYGMAEMKLVASAPGKLVLEKGLTQGKGMYLGTVAAGLQVRIIQASDNDKEQWSEVKQLQPGRIGELCIRTDSGPCGYLNRPDDFQKTIMHEGDGFWFRTGDLCCQDENGALWYCGRKVFQVQTPAGVLLGACCESVFALQPGVRRCQLVGVGEAGSQIPVMIIEPEPAAHARMMDSLDTLRKQAEAFSQTSGIRHFLLKHELDANYEKNAQWAAEHI